MQLQRIGQITGKCSNPALAWQMASKYCNLSDDLCDDDVLPAPSAERVTYVSREIVTLDALHERERYAPLVVGASDDDRIAPFVADYVVALVVPARAPDKQEKAMRREA